MPLAPQTGQQGRNKLEPWQHWSGVVVSSLAAAAPRKHWPGKRLRLQVALSVFFFASTVFLYPCVCGCDSSSFQRWWTSCHSSSPCRWTASRRCECACEPAASAARRSSSRSPRHHTWTSGRSLGSKQHEVAQGSLKQLYTAVYRLQVGQGLFFSLSF